MSSYEELKLENQLCFPLYAASRLVTKAYQPLLDELDITYPQYLVLLLLWEYSPLGVKEIGEKLYLGSNTLTPLLKRLESKGIVTRERSQSDERKVLVALTQGGLALKERASCIPYKLTRDLKGDFPLEDFIDLREKLKKFIALISEH